MPSSRRISSAFHDSRGKERGKEEKEEGGANALPINHRTPTNHLIDLDPLPPLLIPRQPPLPLSYNLPIPPPHPLAHAPNSLKARHFVFDCWDGFFEVETEEGEVREGGGGGVDVGGEGGGEARVEPRAEG